MYAPQYLPLAQNVSSSTVKFHKWETASLHQPARETQKQTWRLGSPVYRTSCPFA